MSAERDVDRDARMQSVRCLLRQAFLPGTLYVPATGHEAGEDKWSPCLKDADILSSSVPEKNEAGMKGG